MLQTEQACRPVGERIGIRAELDARREACKCLEQLASLKSPDRRDDGTGALGSVEEWKVPIRPDDQLASRSGKQARDLKSRIALALVAG